MLFCEVLELSYFHQILFSHGSSHKFLQKLTPPLPPHTHTNINASPNGDKECDDDMVSSVLKTAKWPTTTFGGLERFQGVFFSFFLGGGVI